ncbi:hypothetical protein EIP86_006724 [Pleurotus ostreatoroseus]|nr:hypothetical protein EIP86_006724 [Pleurotus ostreatoroseus]
MTTSQEPVELGSLGGLTIHDVPQGADMNLMPHGDPRTQKGSHVYVVWRGYKVGLFYSWNDTDASVNGYSGARYQKFGTLEEARIAFWAMYQSKGNTRPTEAKPRPRNEDRPAGRSSAAQPRAEASRTSSSSRHPSSGVSSTHRSTSSPTPRASLSGNLTPTPSSRREVITQTPSPSTGRSHSRRPTVSEDGLRTPLSDASSVGSSVLSPSSSIAPTTHSSAPNPWEIPVNLRNAYEAARDTGLTWVVIRGRRPGVYREAFDAFAALGPSLRAKIVSAASYDEGCRGFTRQYMANHVERIWEGESN